MAKHLVPSIPPPPDPFIPKDPEAFGRLPMEIRQILETHHRDALRVLSAAERAVQGMSEEQIRQINADILRAMGADIAGE